METFDFSKVPVEEKFAEVGKFIAKLQDNFVAFGELLSNIKSSGDYMKKGYKTFKEFIEKEYNISGAFASKLIDTFELYMDEMGLDETEMKMVGFDRLNMIKPIVKKAEKAVGYSWIEEAKTTDTPDLREKIKEEKERTKKKPSMKDELIRQYLEKMCTHLNCSAKELSFMLALYFQDADLDSIKVIIKEKKRRFENNEL